MYGKPQYLPIDEDHPKRPVNPYGRTKLMVEQMLFDFEKAYGMKFISLRFFNACGADPEGELGECHEPETHLIPLALQAASGRRSDISIFGTDYGTHDGTCIRDYIHVEDLCSAHWLGLQHLINGGSSGVFNLGNGGGFSVQQVIDTCEDVTERKISVIKAPRRQGDPARLVADANLISKTLGWRPVHTDLASIIKHAWDWEIKLARKMNT
jgi:UDP-glucose 4-epimerase